MSVAKVSEIVSEVTKTTTRSLDEAIKQGIAGGSRKIRNVRVWWIKEKRVAERLAHRVSGERHDRVRHR